MVRAELLSFLANKMPILIAGDTSPKLCDRNLCFTVQQWPALSFKVFQVPIRLGFLVNFKDLFTSHPEFKSNMLISRLEEQFSAFECPGKLYFVPFINCFFYLEEGEIALCNALQALGIRLISIRSDTMGFWCMVCVLKYYLFEFSFI